jgi:hypothetical protein
MSFYLFGKRFPVTGSYNNSHYNLYFQNGTGRQLGNFGGGGGSGPLIPLSTRLIVSFGGQSNMSGSGGNFVDSGFRANHVYPYSIW